MSSADSPNPFLSRVGLNYSGASPVPVWVDSLPGMSVELAENLRDEEAEALWARIQPVALNKLLTTLESIMANRKSFQHQLARTLVDLPSPLRGTPGVSTLDLLPAPGLLVTSELAHDFATLSLGKLSFFSLSPFVEEVVLLVRAVDELEPLRQQTITVSPGMNSINLDVAYPVVMAETTLQIQLLVADVLQLRVLGDNLTTDERQLRVSPEYNTPVTMHLQASISCDFAQVCSRYVQQLQWAYAYQCASVLLDEKLSSNLFNLFTNTNRDDTFTRKEDYCKEANAQIGRASAGIIRDLERVGSPYIITAPDEQPGTFMGSYV